MLIRKLGEALIATTLAIFLAIPSAGAQQSFSPQQQSFSAQEKAEVEKIIRDYLLENPELLVEVIPPRDLPADDATLARAMTAIYDRGVYPDWWKLPPPASKTAWSEISAVLDERDPHCRGIVH